MGPVKIDNYALIGDSHTAALVGSNGSIDWLCFPRFDSPACFAALLGDAENGHWRISPLCEPTEVRRRYRGDSLILDTRFRNAEGAANVVDYMPPRRLHGCVVREAIGVRGKIRMTMRLIGAFGYGQVRPWLRHTAKEIRIQAGSEALLLRSSVPFEVDGYAVRATFTLKPRQRAVFTLRWHPSHLPPEKPERSSMALRRTRDWWQAWHRDCPYRGPYRQAVRRSLLVIKALTYAPTGGLAAAPTASLPERLGGSRNWDYRYCWLRDAAFGLDALLSAGCGRSARAGRDWLVRSVAGDPKQIQTAYSVRGERRLSEWEVSGLKGYGGSRPVRIGNDAALQFQLDVYGEVVNALHLVRTAEKTQPDGDSDAWQLQIRLLEHVESCWQRNDHGIWEERGRPQPFTYSKVMAWVAADRTVKAISKLGYPGDLARWRRLRSAIRQDILARGFNRASGAFTQSFGSRTIDASVLRLPLVGFLPVRDPRIRSTVKAVEQKLVEDGIVVRRCDKGRDHEAAFLPCSFWLAAYYILSGQKRRGRALFERLLGFSNDLKLFSEEYDVKRRMLMGNFPQALTHIALVRCATLLGPKRSAFLRK